MPRYGQELALTVGLLVLAAMMKCGGCSQQGTLADRATVSGAEFEPPVRWTRSWTYTLCIPMLISAAIAPLIYKACIWGLGFRSAGIARHSMAAGMMSRARYGSITPNTPFACIQSMAHHGTSESEVVTACFIGAIFYGMLFAFYFYPMPVCGLNLFFIAWADVRAMHAYPLSYRRAFSYPTTKGLMFTGKVLVGAWVAFQVAKCMFYILQAFCDYRE